MTKHVFSPKPCRMPPPDESRANTIIYYEHDNNMFDKVSLKFLVGILNRRYGGDGVVGCRSKSLNTENNPYNHMLGRGVPASLFTFFFS